MSTPLEPCWPEVNWRVQTEFADFAENVRVVVMACCGFAYDAIHTDGNGKTYSCPLCAPDTAETVQARELE